MATRVDYCFDIPWSSFGVRGVRRLWIVLIYRERLRSSEKVMNSLRGSISNRQVTHHIVQRLQSLKLHRASAAASNVSSAINNEDKIMIPYRIERSSTDILNALEKTISRDPGAPHYKYLDDPFLSPVSNRGKRAYALAKEAGRKAAAWIHAEYAELFNQRLAEPEIKAFLPKAKYDKKEEVSEALLMDVIKEGSVTDALNIYKLLEDEASAECKQALLELLCYYNNQEQLPEELIEERWYRKTADRQRQIWTNNPEVEKLFEFLKQQDEPTAAAAYNAMICGTAKYMKVDRAWALFEECEQKNIPLNIETYNQLMNIVKILKDGAQERKFLMFDMFKKIQQAGLKPNVGTLNSALRVAAAMNTERAGKDLARLLFTEFKNLGVEPCLASYYFALVIFCRDRSPRSAILREIIKELEGKTLTMQDLSDTFFFVTAMDVARNHLADYELAERIHKLLLTGSNYDFIGEGFKESIYYRHYMVLSLKSLPLKSFMKFYDLMVPHIYIPEPSVMDEILNTVEQTDIEYAGEILPRLWSHMIMFEHLDREPCVSKALQIMTKCCSSSKNSPINAQFAEAAWSYWTFVKEQSEYRGHKATWTSKTLADAAIVLLKADQFQRFLEVLNVLVHKQKSLIGTMDVDQVTTIFEACLECAHAAAALDILKYSAEAGFEESISMGKKIQANILLSPEQEMLLVNLIGSEISKTTDTSKTEVAE